MFLLGMGKSKLTNLLLQNVYRGRLQNIARRAAHTEDDSRSLHQSSGSNWRAALEEKLRAELPTLNGTTASIYKVPTDVRRVETKAYEPNIISIGPYHHGVPRLQAMEELKWKFFHQFFHPSKRHYAKLETLINGLKEIEQDARSCYSENMKLSSDKFIKIMLIDGCFIVQLLAELKKNDFRNGPDFIKRWMLPVLRCDMIMLENQLPLFVLRRVHNLTSNTGETCLEDLALEFFEPLMFRDSNTLRQSTLATAGDSKSHFLDLFRDSILPTEMSRGKEPHMFRSMAELKESGVKLKIANNCQPLGLSFKTGVLTIPPLYFGDYRFTLFRNMVAFEQCHFACKPDITTYIFFLDGLINSAKDIEILHYAGVIQHSLGGNKQVARLVNKLCKEVARDVEESYLHEIVWKINCYCNDGLITKRARLKHDYFYNPWASISTIAAIILLYLSLLQTSSGLGSAEEYMERTGFWNSLMDSFSIPFTGSLRSKKTSKVSEDGSQDYFNILGIKISASQLDNIQSLSC